MSSERSILAEYLGAAQSDDDVLLMFQALRPEEARDFLTVLRLMMPHEQPDLAVARLMSAVSIDAQLVANLPLRALIREGLAGLNASCTRDSKLSFSAAPDDQRIAALRECEESAFFQTLLHIAKADFYNRHAVWRALGYPDLDHEAGYLDDNFDRLAI